MRTIFIIFAALLSLYLMVHLTINNSTVVVEKNQLWVREISEKNPFEEAKYDTIRILDVVDNYALVKINNDTLVYETDMITHNRKLIK